MARRDLHRAVGRDVEILDSARAAYAEVNLPRALEKGFGLSSLEGSAVTDFTMIGTEVRGARGIVASPLAKRLSLFHLSASALSGRKTSLELLQRHAGLFVHPFMHRRELMCVFSKLHRWMANLKPGRFEVWDRDVHEELLIATLFLPLAEADIRWPISRRISRTDATPVRGGGGPCPRAPRPRAKRLPHL